MIRCPDIFMKNKIAIIIIIISCIFCAFVLFKPKKEAPSVKKIEQYKQEDDISGTKLTGETVDLSYKYSKKEKEKIRIESDELLDKYFPLYFNFEKEPSEENNKIFSYHTESFNERAKQTFWKRFTDFSSKYISRETGYFEIQEDGSIEIGCIVHAHLLAKGLREDDYDAYTTVTLQKEDDAWKVAWFEPSTIFEKGSAGFYENEMEDCITLNGEYVDTFSMPEAEKEEPFGDQKVYGDIIDDEDILDEEPTEETGDGHEEEGEEVEENTEDSAEENTEEGDENS